MTDQFDDRIRSALESHGTPALHPAFARTVIALEKQSRREVSRRAWTVIAVASFLAGLAFALVVRIMGVTVDFSGDGAIVMTAGFALAILITGATIPLLAVTWHLLSRSRRSVSSHRSESRLF